jgi:hypothetical protein
MGEQMLRTLLKPWVDQQPGPRPMQLSGGDGEADEEARLLAEPPFTLPTPEPVLMCAYDGGGMWRRAPSALTAADVRALPSWVTECVLRRIYVEPAAGLKLGFYLIPCDGLQAISKAKLSAPRILPMRKVQTFVAERLGLEESSEKSGQPAVQLVCNDVVVQPHMSLATVRQYVWKKGEDVELCYRMMSP